MSSLLLHLWFIQNPVCSVAYAYTMLSINRCNRSLCAWLPGCSVAMTDNGWSLRCHHQQLPGAVEHASRETYMEQAWGSIDLGQACRPCMLTRSVCVYITG